MIETVNGVVQSSVDLSLDDGLRQRNLDGLEQLLENLVADLTGLLDLADACDALTEVSLQFFQGVELAGELSELVVLSRKLALLDRLHGHGDNSFLACVLAGDQRRREVLGLPRLEADDGFVEALDELARTDLVRQSARGCLGNVLAVDGGRQIDGDEVAVLDCAVDAGEGAETLTQRKQLLFDASSVISIGSTSTLMELKSGSSISGGRTSTSAVNSRSSPSSILVTSISGWPMAFTPALVTASE